MGAVAAPHVVIILGKKPMKAREYKPMFSDGRATKRPYHPYDWEVECPDYREDSPAETS